MKKIMTVVGALLISSSVFAASQVIHSDKNFSTEAFTEKSQAYEAGFNYLDALKGLSDVELTHKLLVISQSPVKDIKIDNSKVSIEEFAQTRGQLAYRAVINLDYHFTTLKTDNH